MALHAFMPLNALQCNSLTVVKFPPKLGGHDRFPSTTNSVKGPAKACLAAKISKENVRPPVVKFPPSVWKDLDFSASKPDPQELESNDKQIEELKEKVNGMLMAPSNDPVQKVGLIDTICRLGVSYHFENEIEQLISRIFESQMLNLSDYDLYTVALLFRVFRQHGYKMPCNVFDKFKDSNGKFKESLACDVKGMLSLYEASHLSIRGEDVLDEALAFTTAHLKSMAHKSDPCLVKQVISSLDMPFHRGMPRVEACKYISFYEEDPESKNETLLLFAKLDFNRLQLLYQQELSHLLSWWKILDVASKLRYARDRLVEIYFWMVGICCDPCHSKVRLILTKVNIIISVIDDTFDAYGTLEELQNFSDAIQRWNISALDQLPDYMKFLYKIVFDLFDDLNNDAINEGRSCMVSYAKEKVKEMVRAYLLEAQWHNEGYVPPFDEYLDNGVISAGCFSVPATTFLGMGEIAGSNAIEWLESKPKIVEAAYLLGRLIDDVMSHEAEQKREGGHVASGVECYMKQYNISREEAIEKLNSIVADAWKDINEECMRPRAISMQILLPVVNLARLVEVSYHKIDRYTNSEYLKDFITKIFIDKVPI